MRGLTASELLKVWERGQGQRPHERALTMLSAAVPERPVADLEAMSIGRRDGLLLSLRELTFGPTLAATTSCPRCGERLEFSFGLDGVRIAPPNGLSDVDDSPPVGETEIGGWTIRFRAPTTSDQAAIAGWQDVTEARAALLERCVLEISTAGEPRSVSDLPDEVVQALSDRMARQDPQADVRISVACPACGTSWEELFDPAAFLWYEISSWAPRLLRDVHALASAYGWREADILRMGPGRRQAYLDLIGAWATS